MPWVWLGIFSESFLSLFVNRFERRIYILDEPETALAPTYSGTKGGRVS